MITGGDLRQSRLDVGYKTFTISPWASTGLISAKKGQNDEYMTKDTNWVERPLQSTSSADYAGSKRLRQAAGKASAPRVAIQAQPG